MEHTEQIFTPRIKNENLVKGSEWMKENPDRMIRLISYLSFLAKINDILAYVDFVWKKLKGHCVIE